MSFRWESIEGWNFVLSSHFYSEKQIPREQTEKPRSVKELLGFFYVIFPQNAANLEGFSEKV